MMTDEQLAAIEAREQAAPVGPWRTYPNPMRSDGVFVGQDRPPTAYRGVMDASGAPIMTAVPDGAWSIRSQIEHAPGEFIAHACQDIPDLIAEVRRLQEELKRVSWEIRE